MIRIVISGLKLMLPTKPYVGGVLSQLTSGRWYPVAYFSRKMIPVETRYETHDQALVNFEQDDWATDGWVCV